MIRSGTSRKATKHGIDSSNVNSMARFCALAAPGFVTGRDPVRHFRQDDRAGGNADDADRQLVEPVGVIERRQRAGGEESSR